MRLVKALNDSGIKSKLLKFPDRTTAIGKMIDGYLTQKTKLSDEAIHLLFSANRWEVMDQMRADLESGTTLVVDRYAFSGVAFSAAKRLNLKWCKAPDVGLIAPDRVFFLDIHPDDAAKRAGYGEEIYEKREMQIEVRVKFFSIMDSTWSVVDAAKDPDEIHRQIASLTMKAFKKHEENPTPISKLWMYILARPWYTVAAQYLSISMDIVAEALEKLAGTMEPLDLPLPLVGPGYYLEIMVKSPKSPHGPLQQPPPPGQINGINIEGGEAAPVTQIEIILPGESVAQETIKLPSGGIAEITLVETDDAQNTAGIISAPEPIPEPGAESNVQPEETSQEGISSQEGVPGSSNLDISSDVTNSIPNEATGELVSDSYFAGQSTVTETPTVLGSQLAQPISPEPMGPMDTVSGFDLSRDGISDTAEIISSSSDGESAVEVKSSSQSMSTKDNTSKLEESASSATDAFATNTTDEVGGGIDGMFGGLYGDQSASQHQESPTGVLTEQTGTGTSIPLVGGTEEEEPSRTFTHEESMSFDLPSSAPILLDSSNIISDINQAASDFSQESGSAEDTLEATTSTASEESIASEAMNTSGMTMESMPLPFPPFGDPQQQQQDMPTTLSTGSNSGVLAETATTSFTGSGGIVETINIVDASNRNVLESSIDAILHSVMDEYETESIPKAAVGFALIHPRNEQTTHL
ncbi:Thymidylate kinase [Coemansia sp. RSA 1813]|nr:Thymidylate kinase [Coemansia sp. RSA 1813]